MPESRPDTPVTIETYLQKLREELSGSDPALMQDVLSDAEDHLRAESEGLLEEDREAALAEIISRYGLPREIADAYREYEHARPAALPAPPPRPAGNPLQRFFGVIADPRAYAAYFYMLFSLVTGVFFFTWAVTGVALSLGLSLMIIGLPFFLFFLASVRAIAYVEGRLVEALIGERMPRRPHQARIEGGIFRRALHWVADPHTWSTIVYMFLKLPIGVLSFSIFITATALSIGLLLYPLMQLVYPHPFINAGSYHYWVPLPGQLAMSLLGFLGIFITLHLARIGGTILGRLAKAMLVPGAPVAARKIYPSSPRSRHGVNPI